MDKLQLREIILNQIERPVIPDRIFEAQQYGIIPDSDEVQTGRLQAAIDSVNEQGGGRLVLPAGRYRTGALRLKSRVELHLQSQDTVLSFINENCRLHYPLVFSHWEATPCYNFSPLIYACDAHDIGVTGVGILDGGADEDHWWNWHHQVENAWSDNKPDLQLEDRSLLRQMNLDGVPVGKRVFGEGHFLRPNFIQPIRCERVLLQGFTLRNSPMWQINPVMCKSLTVDGVTMSSHGANNDGCDPESCSGVHICNCRFDTGDDCISLKSGRDRDGRMANMPCEDVLIENNEFADGHGGIALGSEMSGGIRRVLAMNNRFCSPNLTYALRLKTNARRGGKVEDIILADSVMDCVHGAAVHGTMLYEDGRNGDSLPEFRNITIENIEAHGGDYGIFLEAFEEVPITGLVLRNIRIDGVTRPMRSMNWKDPVIEQVVINGKVFPRPGSVRILGVPKRGAALQAVSECSGGGQVCHYLWQISDDGQKWQDAGQGNRFQVSEDSVAAYIRVTAEDERGNREVSRAYRRLEEERKTETGEGSSKLETGECSSEPGALSLLADLGLRSSFAWQRLLCRGVVDPADRLLAEAWITRKELAKMLLPLAGAEKPWDEALRSEDGMLQSDGRLLQLGESVLQSDESLSRQAERPLGQAGISLHQAGSSGSSAEDPLATAITQGFLALDGNGEPAPDGTVSRQEMATVAMQACGVNYRNASSTMPVCADATQVAYHYGTNVARALYFGFMELEEDGRFDPERFVTVKEAVEILNRVADFAGI